LQIDNGVTIHI